MKSFHFHVKFSYYFEGLYNALHSTVNSDHGVCLTFLQNSELDQYVTQPKLKNMSQSYKRISSLFYAR